MRDWLRRWPAAARARLIRLNFVARRAPSFATLADDPEWRRALLAARSGKRILIATNTGGHFAVDTIDRMLGAALTMRGAAVTHVLCDAALPACLMCEFNLTTNVAAFARSGPDRLLCSYCFAPARDRLIGLGLPVRTVGDALTDGDRRDAKVLAQAAVDDLARVEWRGIFIGAHALAGTLRFFARSDLENEPHAEAVLRRYVEASALTAAAYSRLLDELDPEVLVAHHGIYTPQGIAVAAARAKGVRVVTWNPAYRRHCFIFSHDDSYHYTLMDEPTESWRTGSFSDAARESTLAYLHSRRRGDGDWTMFHRKASAAPKVRELRLDPGKPVIAAYTNVFWDAQLHFPKNAFAGQREWLERTIAWFAERPDLQLVIRVHPAEISGSPPSRQRAADMITESFPRLPDNVRVVASDSALSSYELADCADAALIFGTKLGVELSAIGVPVIVAGEAWVRGKGFTHDATSPEDYEAKLALLPFGERLAPEVQDLALRYAHHFFFGRMLELPFVQTASGAHRFRVEIKSSDELRPGLWSGLDTICNGILGGAAFVTGG